MAPRIGHVFASFEDRFWSKVSPEPNTGCWLWDGADNSAGYGTFWVGRSRGYAHRASYEHFVGSIPQGLHLDHKCRVRCCVNPDHLEPVTNKENARRGNAGVHMKTKTHCVRGHPFEESGYIDSSGGRQCRVCSRLRYAAYYQRKKNVQ